MNILLVDDEEFALRSLCRAVEGALPGSNLHRFDRSQDAYEFAKTAPPIDVAFLDINMGGMNGMQLAKRLKEIYGKTNIIFVTGHSQYAIDAANMHISGYLMKPIIKAAVTAAMDNLLHPPEIGENGVRVQCFGNFEIYVDNQPLTFSRSKAKELFAYLVYRQGAQCSNNEIIAILWEDHEDTDNIRSHFRHLVADLKKTLKLVGIDDVLVKKRGYLSIATDKIKCDWYDLLSGVNVNRYMGEFMTQYSWGEFTNAYLERTYW